MWLWSCLSLVGAVQLFTVNTAPYQGSITKHTSERLPASTEPISVDVTKATETAAEAITKTEGPAPDERLILMSWNVKALAREGADYDRAALVLADADVVILHEMNLAGQGKGFLNVLGDLMEGKSKQKFCRAWVQAADGTRMPYGILWRESMVGYMEMNGEMHEECSSTPITIWQHKDLHHGIHATFYTKMPRKVFELAAVFYDKKPKSAQQLGEIFHSAGSKQWPILMAGDFKIGARDSMFNEVGKSGYQTALDSTKRSGRASLENFWYKNAVLASSGTVNLYQRFGDSRRRDIEQGLSDLFPIAIEFRIRADPKEEQLASTLIAKAKAPPAKKKDGEKEKEKDKEKDKEKEKVGGKGKGGKAKKKVAKGKAKSRHTPEPEETLEEEAGRIDKVVESK
jgi:hypothetical protein